MFCSCHTRATDMVIIKHPLLRTRLSLSIMCLFSGYSILLNCLRVPTSFASLNFPLLSRLAAGIIPSALNPGHYLFCIPFHSPSISPISLALSETTTLTYQMTVLQGQGRVLLISVLPASWAVPSANYSASSLLWNLHLDLSLALL
jgi:hypothetical protein